MIATVVIIVITLLNVIVFKLRQIQEANLAQELNISQSEQSCRRFSLAEIQSATYNFDDALVLGKGGFGKVYKGVIDNGATTVAVKRLNPMSKQGAPEFWREIEMLSNIRHSHIVSLIGYCNQRNEMILVYEYMVRGTIADHLHKNGRNGGDNSTLSWVERLKICIGAARGLDYLHTGTGVKERVIHRDVKSSNILLDENWAAKISDFGLSKIGPANQSTTHVSTNVKGTIGYLDIEYFLTHRLTRKSDVYAFGVVLFEVLCGRPAVDFRLDVEQCGLAGWAHQCIKEGKLYRIIDPDLSEQILPDSLAVFEQIADQCLHKFSKKRPTMAEVVVSLERSLALQERIDSSMLEGEIFYIGGAFLNEENADSYMEQHEVINADSFIEQQEIINAGNDLHEELIDGISRLGDASNEQKQIDENTDSPREQPKVIRNAGNGVGQIDRIMLLGDANNSQSQVNPAKTMAFRRKLKLLFFGKARGTSEKSSKNTERAQRRRDNLDHPQVINVQNYSIFAATWNVGGKCPSSNLNLDDWLHASSPADIYVLGFQEIVPLNAGNILGAEDKGPAKKWLALIRKTLNNLPGTSGGSGYYTPSPIPDPIVESVADFEGSTRQNTSSFFHRRSFQTPSSIPQPRLDRRFSVCDRAIFGHRPSDFDPNARWGYRPSDYSSGHRPSDYSSGQRPSDYSSVYRPSDYSSGHRPSDYSSGHRPSNYSSGYRPSDYSSGHRPSDYSRWGSSNDDYWPGDGGSAPAEYEHSRYCLVASKQMVGIFLTIWVRSDLREHVRNMKVSCVGRGLMGYLGNKGSVSVSMSLHQTSFCFVCSHLTSGQKEGDELQRNSDVVEIVRKTRFPRVHGTGNEKSPETILEHDRIIWLGDLNYRVALSSRTAKALAEMQNWRALLENDQLRIEQRRGRVFVGWKEGKIYFPPTYKYSNKSDRYTGDDMNPKEKRRTPAWCDRILWYGGGLQQLSYVRGESRFSDHRPVYSIFWAEVESVHNRLRKSMSYSSSRIEVEELLPYSHGYTELCFF